MAAPTFVSENETVWNSSTDPKTTGSISVQAGDILVAISGAEGADGTTTCVISGGSLTWTVRQEVDVNDYAHVQVATATAASTTSITVSADWEGFPGGREWRGLNVLVFRASDGIGASAQENGTDTGGTDEPSLSITTTQANSAIVVANGDWNATDGASRTWRTGAGTATEVTYFRDSSHYAAYGAYHADAGTAEAKTVGLSAPSGQKYSIVAVEVKGTASSSLTASPGVGSLTITGQAPSVKVTQSAAPGVAALSVTGLAPTLRGNETVRPGVDALAIAGQAPTANLPQSAAPGAGALTLTGLAPIANLKQSASPGAGALTITGLAPVASLTQSVAPGVGALTITGLAPTVRLSLSAAPSVASLTISGLAPVANLTHSAAPGAGALTITGLAPSVTVSAAGAVVIGAGALTITGLAPTANLTQSAAPGAGALTVTGFAPSVVLTQVAAPGAGALVITGQAPTANLTQSAAPGAADLVVTGYAPTLLEGGNLIRAPGCAALELIGYAPECFNSGDARQQAAGGKRKRAKPRRILEEAELTPEQREALGLSPIDAPQPEATPKPPKRAKRTGRRGIQLQPDDEAQEAAAGLAQRTAALIAAARAQEAQNAAALAAAREAQAMLEAAVAIEAENEMIMLLLMAA